MESERDGRAVDTDGDLTVKVRRLHRRDLNRVWEFLKRVFRDVNRETVEYQRPRTKQRFLDVYEQPIRLRLERAHKRVRHRRVPEQHRLE